MHSAGRPPSGRLPSLSRSSSRPSSAYCSAYGRPAAPRRSIRSRRCGSNDAVRGFSLATGRMKRFSRLARFGRTTLIALLIALLGEHPIVAQTQIAGDSIHAAKTLFTWRDPVLAAGFVGLTFALLPAD